nr:hypothetical protein [Candidatus Sigynarchaeota archaeon]
NPNIVLGILDNNSKWVTLTELSSLSVFVFIAREIEQITGPVIDPFTVFILIAAIVGVVGTATFATRKKKTKEQIIPGKKKTCKNCGKYVKPYVTSCPYCNARLTDEETLVDAMNKLSHLFIFHDESGVCLYYHPFTESKIDPQLISGFLSAITSFGGQFDDATKKKKETTTAEKATGSDLRELVYKEYRILMETSGACKFAVLITGQASKILNFKISQFIKHFMRTYEDVLKDWKGNVRVFKDVEQMVRLIFGLTKVQDTKGKPSPSTQIKPASQPPEGVASEGGRSTPSPSPAPPAPPKPPTAPGYPAQFMKRQQPPPQASGTGPQGDPHSSVGLFELKGRIGQPGEPMRQPGPKPTPEPPKDPFSPAAPPEKGKKKKK